MKMLAGAVAGVCIFSLASSPLPAADQGGASYEISFSRGIVEMNAGRYREALESFGRASAARPGDIEARYHIALCCRRVGRSSEAAEILRRILEDNPEYEPARVERGAALLEAGRYREAAGALEEAIRRNPGNAKAEYYLGEACGLLGERERSLEHLARAGALDERYASLSDYAMASVYEDMGNRVQARAALERVVRREPRGTELRRNAEAFLAWLGKREGPRRLRLGAQTRYEYDDNVLLLPDDTEIVGVSDGGDFRFATRFELEAVPIAKGPFAVTTTYDFYQSVHNRLGDFNLQAHELDTIATASLGAVQPFCGYIYRYYFLDDCKQSFIRDHELLAGINLLEGRHSLSSIYYSYLMETNFLPYYEPGDNRSGHTNSVGLDQYVFFLGGRRYVRFGLGYDRNDATGRNYTYNGYRFTWELYCPLVWGWEFDGRIEYFPRDFPVNIDDRRDHRQEYDFSLGRRLNDHVTVGFEYYRVVNNSNVPLFHFDRNIYSIVADFNF
jgi:Flp pilus assembly protein TadD